MIQTVEGVFRYGMAFLPEPAGRPSFMAEETAELAGKFEAWQEDWNAPGMEAYDDDEARRRGAGPVSPK